MKKYINKIMTSAGLMAFAVASVGIMSLGLATPASAAANCDSGSLTLQSGVNCAKGEDQPEELFGGEGSIFTIVTNVMLFLVGAVSVIMLIVGGIRYTVSAGDQGAVQGAKGTIMYAIIGIIVAILAFAVVNFVTSSFIK